LNAFTQAYEREPRVDGAPNGDNISIPAIEAYQIGLVLLPPRFDFTSGLLPSGVPSPAEVLFRQSKFAKLESDSSEGKQQNIYLNENLKFFPLGAPYPLSLNTPSGGTQTFEPSPSLFKGNLFDVDGSGNSYARNVKTSFSPFDQYLLGQKSCGSYLFISPEDHEVIQVEGDSSQSTKPIVFGNTQSLNIPLTFQYRMTDYYGSGSGSTGGGRGKIAGDVTGATVNVTYSKRLGFDVYTSINDVFQFDVEVFATYRSDKLNIDTFPAATISKSLSNLEKIVSSLSTSVTETKVNQSLSSASSPFAD
jgi:hypothetical protein